MKKRTVKLPHGKSLIFNYLLMVSVEKLKNYVEEYFGEPTDKLDPNIASCVEVLNDSVIGSVYKIDYVEPTDLDDISQIKSLYLGQFGHLYKTKHGFEYTSITDLENLSWFKFMQKQLSNTNLSESYPHDFKEAHKVALIINKNRELDLEHEHHKARIVNIEERFADTFDCLEEYGVEYFLETIAPEID